MKVVLSDVESTFEHLDKLLRRGKFETVVAITEDVYKNAKKNIEPHTHGPHEVSGSRLENNLDMRVHKNEGDPYGEVFIQSDGMLVNWDNKSINYALFVHFGTKDHKVKPRKKKALRWATVEGFVFSKGHKVSGIKADPFMYNALDETMKNIDKIFKRVYDGL